MQASPPQQSYSTRRSLFFLNQPNCSSIEMKRERLLVGISKYIFTQFSFSWLRSFFMQSTQKSKHAYIALPLAFIFTFFSLFAIIHPVSLGSTLLYLCIATTAQYPATSQDIRAWVIKLPLKPESAFCHPSYDGEEAFSTLGLIGWAKIQSCHIRTVQFTHCHCILDKFEMDFPLMLMQKN